MKFEDFLMVQLRNVALLTESPPCALFAGWKPHDAPDTPHVSYNETADQLRRLGYSFVGDDDPTRAFPMEPPVMQGSPDCAGFSHPLSGRTEIDA